MGNRPNAIERYHQINHELAAYDPELLKRPQIIVATKMDLPDAQENLAHFKEMLAQDDIVCQDAASRANLRLRIKACRG